MNSYRTGFASGFGHEMAGVIEKVGKDCDFAIGMKVFVSNLSRNLVSYAPEVPHAYMGGFADYILVKNAVEQRELYLIPDEMEFAEAALVEPFCVGMAGVKKYPVTAESKVVILGAGIIGMCAFAYLKSHGVKDIVVVDVNAHRLALAEKAGAISFHSQKGDLKDFLTGTFGSSFSMLAGMVPDVDLYIDAAGSVSLMNTILDIIKIGGQITVLAAYHDLAAINMASFMYNSVKMVGSCMFTHEDILEAIEVLSENKTIADVFITHRIPFSDAVEGFCVANDPDQCLKVMLID